MDSCRWGGPRAWPLCDLGHDTAIPNPSTNQIETKRYLRYPVLLSRWLIIFTHAPLAFIFHAHITKQDPFQVFILIKGTYRKSLTRTMLIVRLGKLSENKY